VVASVPGGRTLYDNRVDARMRRHEAEIRRIVYESMFPETGDGG
jgi:vacuolar-type H+-ATPase subunit E/Vma4